MRLRTVGVVIFFCLVACVVLPVVILFPMSLIYFLLLVIAVWSFLCFYEWVDEDERGMD